MYKKVVKFSFTQQKIFRVLVFSFIHLVSIDPMDRSEVTNIQKYYVIFVYILHGKIGKTGRKSERISCNKSDQNTKNQKMKIRDERNIRLDNFCFDLTFKLVKSAIFGKKFVFLLCYKSRNEIRSTEAS